VALYALSTGAADGMAVVDFAVVFTRGMLVAGDAELIALVLELRGMRIVAVGTADVLRIHLAFEERRVFVDLVENLTVCMVGGRCQDFVGKEIVVVAASGVACGEDAAAGVAGSTGLNLRYVAGVF